MLSLHFSALKTFKSESKSAKGALVLVLPESGKLTGVAEAVNTASEGQLKKVIGKSNFEGKAKQLLTLPGFSSTHYDALILIGAGKVKELDALLLEVLGGKITDAVNSVNAKAADIVADSLMGAKLSDAAIANALACGLQMKHYHFDRYLTTRKEADLPSFAEATLVTADTKAANALYEESMHVLTGTFHARDLVNEPGNILHPESYAKHIQEVMANYAVKVKVLGEKELAKLGCGAMLGVGQGSIRESKMVIMEYYGAGKKDQPIAFVGKGVTFDTGGISIKPSGGMEDMKMDMGGSAAVVGTIQALAARKAQVNAIGVVGLVENMPDGNAQRPGDIVTSLSGQTIEVLNTDAEGRLVLADCLWYCQDTYKPQFMIDLATLTGAIMVSLGETKAGLFSNTDKLVKQLEAASKATGEEIWHMPMGEEYDKLLKSEVADMQNISSGRWGGSITAAQFLKRFVNDTPWVHLDIAGVATASKPTDTCRKGGTGFGVRLLDRFVKENYEG